MFRVEDVDTAIHAVVIERNDLSTENVSLSLVTLVPIPKSSKELLEDTGLQTNEELGK